MISPVSPLRMLAASLVAAATIVGINGSMVNGTPVIRPSRAEAPSIPPWDSVHGWMRVRAAFSVDEAVAMRAAAWPALATLGIRRSDPSTWTRERPEHLQHVKDDPAFRAVGSARLLRSIDAVLEGHAYEKPNNWGALFLAFPSRDARHVPARGWYSDANYLSALSPPAGVRTHALFGDVAARAAER